MTGLSVIAGRVNPHSLHKQLQDDKTSISASALEISRNNGRRDCTREETNLTTFFSKSLIVA